MSTEEKGNLGMSSRTSRGPYGVVEDILKRSPQRRAFPAFSRIKKPALSGLFEASTGNPCNRAGRSSGNQALSTCLFDFLAKPKPASAEPNNHTAAGTGISDITEISIGTAFFWIKAKSPASA